MEKIRQEKNLNVPNALTLLRLLLVPFFIWTYLGGQRTTSFVIFMVVQLTDLLDGIIARRYHLVTNFGKLMDPLADKLMLLSVLVCFTVGGQLPLWVLIVMLSKETLMIVGSVYALKKQVVVQAQFAGKLATVLFGAMVVATLLDWALPAQVLLYAALATTLWAFCAYTLNLFRTLPKDEGQ